MSRPTFLNVPFREKDEAKSLGARWDAAQKRWYVPADKDLEPFQRWLADADEGAPPPKTAAKSATQPSSGRSSGYVASKPRYVETRLETRERRTPERWSDMSSSGLDAPDPVMDTLNLALLQASADELGLEGEPDLGSLGLQSALASGPDLDLDDGIELGRTYDDGSDFGLGPAHDGLLDDGQTLPAASIEARQDQPDYGSARPGRSQVRSPLDHAQLARHDRPLLASLTADLAPDLAPSLPRNNLPAPLSTAIDLPRDDKAVSLSLLLAGVATAVARAFTEGQWTTAEVVQARLRNGHVYLELSERDPQGKVLAKANGMIWARQAQKILPHFEKATGATIGPGIKLMLKARPVFHAQFGFSLEIDAIDAEYTLGDLEARKREIRERLKRERVFDNNRALPAPWDYNLVLVVAPEGAAGLGDFQAEAQRLQACGICRFVYVTSRFQGEGAALQIANALRSAIDRWHLEHPALPDAVVIIRGGGAVNDLAWLNDYSLARLICDLPVPVLTGIGHERDNTVLDEVAHTRFDTPSKVIAGIEQLIRKRTDEAKQHFEAIVQRATQGLKRSAAQIEQIHTQSQSLAQRQLALARDRSAQHWHNLTQGAQQALHRAAQLTDQTFGAVRHDATRHWADARQHVPALMTTISNQARSALSSAQHQTALWQTSILDQGHAQVGQYRMRADQLLQTTQEQARSQLHDAGRRAQALMLEVTGQGPAKTLARGFVLARDPQGQTVTRATQAQQTQDLLLEFGDGQVAVKVQVQGQGQPPVAEQAALQQSVPYEHAAAQLVQEPALESAAPTAASPATPIESAPRALTEKAQETDPLAPTSASTKPSSRKKTKTKQLLVDAALLDSPQPVDEPSAPSSPPAPPEPRTSAPPLQPGLFD